MTRRLIAHPVSQLRPPLHPAGRDRGWMEFIPSKVAHRCLPILIANQHGWEIQLPGPVTCVWDGGISTEAITFTENYGALASSHFAMGILTFTVPYLFRTPPGWNLLARGPANQPKPGAHPLEGVCETDWATATFTMNWQLTDPGREIHWDHGEAYCMIVPQQRGQVEEWEPLVAPMDPLTEEAYAAWARHRSSFNQNPQGGWQKDYFQGRHVKGGKAAVEHQTKLDVPEFREAGPVQGAAALLLGSD